MRDVQAREAETQALLEEEMALNADLEWLRRQQRAVDWATGCVPSHRGVPLLAIIRRVVDVVLPSHCTERCYHVKGCCYPGV